MTKSPRKESRSAAVKPKMSAEEALLRARETGEGPIFSEEQQAKLAAFCQLRNVGPVEFLTAYTPYVIGGFSPQATGLELVALFERAVANCPEPAEIIGLSRTRSGRQPSGESPAI